MTNAGTNFYRQQSWVLVTIMENVITKFDSNDEIPFLYGRIYDDIYKHSKNCFAGCRKCGTYNTFISSDKFPKSTYS